MQTLREPWSGTAFSHSHMLALFNPQSLETGIVFNPCFIDEESLLEIPQLVIQEPKFPHSSGSSELAQCLPTGSACV